MPSVGTTGQRGYGRSHEAERKRWAPRVDAGLVDCARCREPIEPGRPWDLGHNAERTAWTGPEHRVCNRRAGAVTANALRKVGVHTSREW
jgi:hypothetical protein